MNLLVKYLLVLLSLLFNQLTFAQCIATDEQCAPVNEWELSLAIGAGVLTNPLNGGSNIPLILIPNVSYYGEKIFFENNALGYSIYDSNDFSLSAISLINRENSFFNRWHPSNIFVPSMAEASTQDPSFIGEATDEDRSSLNVDLEEIADREWALDAGVQGNWFISPKSHLTMQVLHDINKTYNGFNGKIEFNHYFNAFDITNLNWRITTGVNWLSHQQVDYYYGLDKEDNIAKRYFYQGKSALNPYIKIHSVYKLNHNWRLTFTARSEFLSKSITNSPLVEDKVLETIFLGVVYAY